MFAKQLSVFIENRKGRLSEVLEVLKKNNINILSLSLADTTEYGLLRLIVNDPEMGKETLVKEGFSSMTTDIVIVEVSHKAGSLESLVRILSENEINIEYMYGLSIEGVNASIVMKLSNVEKAKNVFDKIGIKTLTAEDLKTLN